MQISKKSLHCRYYNLLRRAVPLFYKEGSWDTPWFFDPQSLCAYFWSVILIGPIFIVHWALIAPILALVAFGFLIVASPFMLFFYVLEKSDKASSCIDLSIEYIKAKKNGICPLIEWID